MRGAPLGNQNAKNSRIFRDSLRRVLATYQDKRVERGQALDAITKNLVEQGLSGEEWAIKEIANRTDGKAVQSTDISVEWTAKTVIQTFTAKLGEAGTLELLKAAKAENLIPILKQVSLERPAAIESEAEPA